MKPNVNFFFSSRSRSRSPSPRRYGDGYSDRRRGYYRSHSRSPMSGRRRHEGTRVGILNQILKEIKNDSTKSCLVVKLSALAMSKIWATVSVQCQAFLMKNDFFDSELYGYVFLV